MSHPRIRNAAVAGYVTRGRVPPAKAAGDAVNGLNDTVRTNQPPRARSKNKLPKSVRYDLENALVGLCDVWFENIKPHLIRNNIKLHVHEGPVAPEASGDHERLPPGAPGCPHHDPGAALDCRRQKVASCVDSSQRLLPASRAPCRKQPASLPRPPQIHSTLSPVTQNPKRSNERKLRVRKRRKAALVFQPPNWRVPRLCRTYSALTPVASPRRQRRIRTASPIQIRTPKPLTHYTTNHKRKGVYKNKSTQTEWPSTTKCKPSRPTPLQNRLFTQIPENRCAANTALAGSTRRESNAVRKSRRHGDIDDHSLFKSDLINIISDKNDKRLRLLFKSPTRGDVPSVMNLARSPRGPKRNSSPKRVKPWR